MANTITSKIELNVELDENRVPEKIHWTAQDGGITNEEAKAMMLAVWDAKTQETLRIDLWTKEMPVDEMKSFVLQTFLSMKQSIAKATGEENLVNLIEDFCAEFEKRISDNPK